MAVSVLAEEEKMEERIENRKLIIHEIALPLETAKSVITKEKTKFFAKLGFLKPKHEEIECESVQLFYEPFIVAKANYFLDYYQKKTYTIKIGEEVIEVIAFDQTLKPEVVKEKGILKRPHRAIVFEAQERIIHKAEKHMALNRTGREIDPTKLPSGSTEPEPEKTLNKVSDRVRELETPDNILDMIRKRTAKRPPGVGRITEEVFEVTEYALVCTPIYEARCRQLKTGEIKIIPISGVTGKMLSL